MTEAFKLARSVRRINEPDMALRLARCTEPGATPALFPVVDRRCDSFTQWSNRASRGLDSATDSFAVNGVLHGE